VSAPAPARKSGGGGDCGKKKPAAKKAAKKKAEQRKNPVRKRNSSAKNFQLDGEGRESGIICSLRFKLPRFLLDLNSLPHLLQATPARMSREYDFKEQRKKAG
jgi:hypothetical protein